MPNSSERQQCVKTLTGLIKDLKNVMLTTISENGALHSRPMACQQIDADGNLWFLTGRSSGKVSAIKSDQHVNVAYTSSHDTWVSVAGRAELVEDRQKTEQMWNPMFLAWFPKGLEDPELALLKVNVDSAEYWDSPSSKLVQLTGFVKALATGEPYKQSPGEHGRVELTSH